MPDRMLILNSEVFSVDIIVFNNRELNEAVSSGMKSICLCDNDFKLGNEPGICYSAVGNVSAAIDMSPMEAAGSRISFMNFSPVFLREDAPIYANVKHGIRPCVRTPEGGSYSSSLAGSFASSFTGLFPVSFAGSFAGSFTASFTESFAYSFAGSFTGSFAGSFAYLFAESFPSSFAELSSMSGSFKASFVPSELRRRKYIVKEFAVKGYGLNLI